MSLYCFPSVCAAITSFSAALITAELYAPAKPLSDVMTTNPIDLIVSPDRKSGSSTPTPPEARSSMTPVIFAAYGRAAFARVIAFTTRVAAISSIARVICFVDWTELIRRRRVRSWPPGIYLVLVFLTASYISLGKSYI